MLQQVDEPDKEVGAQETVKLSGDGTETFATRAAIWKLNVQGVILEVKTPTILVSQALIMAGFDPDKAWHIYLKVVGHSKKALTINDTIDLREPGIEKLRLTPKDVNNGEAPQAARRDFAVLDVDNRHLDLLGLRWETVVDEPLPGQARRWLIIRNYNVPDGYTHKVVDLALEIPLTYPGAQIDMFYTTPKLGLLTGAAIPSTHVEATIGNVGYNGWSRHRGAESQWDSQVDNVITHLALVESALLKELGE
jgi:hypothetical protein